MSSSRKNSVLVQQLCQHIAKLEQTNLTLNEQLLKADLEKDKLCEAFQFSSWKQLYAYLLEMRAKEIDSSKMGKQTRLFEANCSTVDQNYGKSKVQKYMESGRYHHQCGSEYATSPINSLSNISSPQKDNMFASQILKVKRDNHFSYEESPIKSESRVMTRSIRGDTDRQIYEHPGQFEQYCRDSEHGDGYENQNQDQDEDEDEGWGTDKQNMNMSYNYQNQHMGKNNFHNGIPTFSDRYHSLVNAPQNEKEEQDEDESVLLCIENTRLRTRINKLEAIIDSRSSKYEC